MDDAEPLREKPSPVRADEAGPPPAARPEAARPEPLRSESVRPESGRPEPARPESARPRSSGPEGDPPSEAPRPARPRSARPTRPTPVRAGLDDGDPSTVDVRVEERPVPVDGASWTAVLMGRGATGSAPTLLVGFRPPDGDAVTREAYVVGESLARVGEAALRDAWTRSRPPVPEDVRRRSLFPDSGGERRRGR